MHTPTAGPRNGLAAHRIWWTLAIVLLIVVLALFTSGVGCRLLDRDRNVPRAESTERVTDGPPTQSE